MSWQDCESDALPSPGLTATACEAALMTPQWPVQTVGQRARRRRQLPRDRRPLARRPSPTADNPANIACR